MAYLLMIVEPAGQRRERGPQQGQAAMARMEQYAAGLQARGLLIAAQSLKTASSRLQLRDGQSILRDGPFSEAKEMVGGFFYLNCETHDEAMALAAACPAAEWATIEVREVGPCFD
ncbi:MAG: YciI family protein [Solimonas sp.]